MLKMFITGIDMRREAWEPMFADRRADEIVLSVLALSSDAPDEVHDELTPEMREAIVAQLPTTLQMIADYWLNPGQGFPRREPVRSAKVDHVVALADA